jgi:hypothetical protein
LVGLNVGESGSGDGEVVSTKGFQTINVTGVSSSLRLKRTDAGACYLVFNDQGSDKVWLQKETNFDFTISTGVESIRCKTGSGYVGIKTAAPSCELDVTGSGCVSGTISIGTTTPLAKLTVFTPQAAVKNIILTLNGLAHGITTMLPTNAFGAIFPGCPDGNTDGGLYLIGIAANPDLSYTPGIVLSGICDEGEGTPSAVEIRGAHKNGTGLVAVPSNNVILDITNNGTSKAQFLGNGSLYIGSSGMLFVDHVSNVTGLHPVTFDYRVELTDEFKMKVSNAAAEPALSNNDNMIIWRPDPGGVPDHVYLLYRRSAGNQCKVELT